jgi:hypothetical protein
MKDIWQMLQGRVLTIKECVELVEYAITRTREGNPIPAIADLLNVKLSNENITSTANSGRVLPDAAREFAKKHTDSIPSEGIGISMVLVDMGIRQLLRFKDVLYDISSNFAGAYKLTLRCPQCQLEQIVDFGAYLHHQSFNGHPYTCSCGDHIELLPVIKINVRVASPVRAGIPQLGRDMTVGEYKALILGNFPPGDELHCGPSGRNWLAQDETPLAKAVKDEGLRLGAHLMSIKLSGMACPKCGGTGIALGIGSCPDCAGTGILEG